MEEKNETGFQHARKPGPASSRVSAGPSGLQGPDGGCRKIWGLWFSGSLWLGPHPLLPSVHLPIPLPEASWSSFCLWALGFPAEMFFLKTGCNRTLNPALWRGSVGASGMREPCARKPDPPLILDDGGGSPAPLWPQFLLLCSEVDDIRVPPDLELVVPAFCQGQNRGGPLRGWAFQACPHHHPALPYPIPPHSFAFLQNEKAGLDLPEAVSRYFRPPQVFETLSGAPTPLPIRFPFIYLKSLNPVSFFASCGHRPWFCDCVFFFVGP